MEVWVSTLISKQGYPCKDIRQWISVNKYSWTDILVFYEYRFSAIHAFMDVHLDILGFLWIYTQLLAMDIHALTFYGFSNQGYLLSVFRRFSLLNLLLSFSATRRYRNLRKSSAFQVWPSWFRHRSLSARQSRPRPRSHRQVSSVCPNETLSLRDHTLVLF